MFEYEKEVTRRTYNTVVKKRQQDKQGSTIQYKERYKYLSTFKHRG
jgi:hypothetical protein